MTNNHNDKTAFEQNHTDTTGMGSPMWEAGDDLIIALHEFHKKYEATNPEDRGQSFVQYVMDIVKTSEMDGWKLPAVVEDDFIGDLLERRATQLHEAIQANPTHVRPSVVCDLQDALDCIDPSFIEESEIVMRGADSDVNAVTQEFMDCIDRARQLVSSDIAHIEFVGWHCFAVQVGHIFADMTANRPNSDIEAEEHCNEFIQATSGEAFGHLLMQTIGSAVETHRLDKNQRIFWFDVAETLGPDHTKSLRHVAAFADKMLSF